MDVVQINLWPGFGGSEVFTAFTARALSRLGYRSFVVTAASAKYWSGLNLGTAEHKSVAEERAIPAFVKANVSAPALVITHFPLQAETSTALREQGILCGFLHQPLPYLNKTPYENYDVIAAVSRHCMDSTQGLLRPNQLYPHPVYGMAELERAPQRVRTLRKMSEFDWDARKPRDRLLRVLEKGRDRIASPRPFTPQGELRIGIVSRLVTMKKFPELLERIVPHLARHSNACLDIYGKGGYSYVKHVKRIVEPLGDRVRFWGHQDDVTSIFATLDYLLVGMPEREGLPLNILEAQAAGVGVLATNAPPFSEAILDGVTGYLFDDSRTDGGKSFGKVLDAAAGTRLDFSRSEAQQFNARFALPAYADRLHALLNFLSGRIGAPLVY